MLFVRLQRLAERCSAALDQHPSFVLVGFTIVFWWIEFARAATKPFWHDEIYTVVLASLPSLRDMWTAQLSGLDLMPPLNAFLTHLVARTIGLNHISARLPAMFGIWTMALASFVMVKRRADTVAAVSALLLPLLIGSAGVAYEARGYGLMLGLFALTMLGWSEAAAGRRRAVYLPMLGTCIGAGLWTHYYAILGIVPIAAGEFVRTFRTRQVDWGVVGAVLAGIAASIPLYPLMRVAFGQSSTYWSRSTLADAANAYRIISEPLFVLPAFWIACTALVAVGLLSPRAAAAQPASRPLSSHEVVAGLTTLTIPIAAVLLGVFVTRVFVARYALAATFGIAVVMPLALSRFGRSRVLTGLVTCLLLAGTVAYIYRDVRPGESRTLASPMSYRPMLARALAASTPVVVTGTLYLQIWYYSSPVERESLHCVASPALALRFLGSDTVDRGYRVLRMWSSARVDDYVEFVTHHSRFALYDVQTLTWLPQKLAEDGAVMRKVGTESGATLYEVTFPDAAVAKLGQQDSQ